MELIYSQLLILILRFVFVKSVFKYDTVLKKRSSFATDYLRLNDSLGKKVCVQLNKRHKLLYKKNLSQFQSDRDNKLLL